MVVYFAPWCPNWQHDAPIAERLYETYKNNGLQVVGVGEYGAVDSIRTNLSEMKVTFPVVYESQSRDDRQKTSHYRIPQIERRHPQLGFTLVHLPGDGKA